jgi:hypothetical protein
MRFIDTGYIHNYEIVDSSAAIDLEAHVISWRKGESGIPVGAVGLEMRPAKAAAWRMFVAQGPVRAGESFWCATPDRDWACVCVVGQAYFVSAVAPQRSKAVDVAPVRGVVAGGEGSVLVLVGDRKLVGLAEGGLMWESAAVAEDGLRDVRVDMEKIVGEGWFPDNGGQWRSFEVIAETGRVKSGGAFDGRQ